MDYNRGAQWCIRQVGDQVAGDGGRPSGWHAQIASTNELTSYFRVLERSKDPRRLEGMPLYRGLGRWLRSSILTFLECKSWTTRSLVVARLPLRKSGVSSLREPAPQVFSHTRENTAQNTACLAREYRKSNSPRQRVTPTTTTYHQLPFNSKDLYLEHDASPISFGCIDVSPRGSNCDLIRGHRGREVMRGTIVVC